MRRSLPVVAFLISFCVLPFAQAQETPPAQASQIAPWWVSMTLGGGLLRMDSDQQQGDRAPATAISFALGHRIAPRARAGVQLGGWTMQAFDFNDPTVGESVSTAMGVVDVFPWRTQPVFARGGLGWSTYTNNHPTARGGGGFAWEGGGGYEFRLSRSLRLAPMVEYSAGNLDNASDVTPHTNSRYSVIEFKLALLYRFGS